MNRRLIALAFCGGVLSAQPVWAVDHESRILSALAAQGFTHIEVSRTWLGRTHIMATGPSGTREIVISPNNGEVLRDHFTADSHAAEHSAASGGSGEDASGHDSGGHDSGGDGGGGDGGGGGGGGDD